MFFKNKSLLALLALLAVIIIVLSALRFFTQEGNQNSPIHTDITSDTQAPPNVLLILTDDQGWGDFGFTGNDVLETPHLDKLSEEGAFFERFYVSPVCAPTRASLLTGRDALRTGVFYVTRNGEALPSDEFTLAEALKGAGYSTGAFGKWHNGAHMPEHPNGQGFDTFFGFASGHLTLYFNSVLERNGVQEETTGYVADTITDEAIKFIEKSDEAPFFAYVALNTPHSPFELKEGDFQKYSALGLNSLDGSVYGMVDNIDQNVGRLMDALEAQGLKENTIVLFLSDNGPAFPGGNSRYNGGLKGSKGGVDEGSLRVPLLVHWPEKIDANTAQKDLAFQHIDIFPTLLSIIGIDVDPSLKLDGVDLSAAWLGLRDINRDKLMFTSRMRNTRMGDENGVVKSPGAVRSQKWAAIKSSDKKWSLYDIEEDEEQTKDLSKIHPLIMADMIIAYDEWFDIALAEGQPKHLPITISSSNGVGQILPAHEALLFGDGISYAHGWGWSHDWIKGWESSTAKAVWPIKIEDAGTYTIQIAYQGDENKIAQDLIIKINGKPTEFKVSKAYKALEVPGARRFETGEAPELQWGWSKLGDFIIEKGVGEIVLQLPDKNTGPSPDIKAIKLTRKTKK